MSDKEVTKPAEYRPIKDFPGYRVGDDGSVWSCRKRGTARVRLRRAWIKLHPSIHGRYLVAALCNDGKITQRSIHKIVLEAFCEPKPIGMQACHNNGVTTDNRIANLRWDTPRNNNLDKRIHGTVQHGERNGNSRITNEAVREIRVSAGSVFQKDLARKFGIHQSTVIRIQQRKTWTHIT